jgi:hypothetical protein
MAMGHARRTVKRCQLGLARKRAAVSADDRRKEKELRERVRLAGGEQTLATLGSGQTWVRLSDEHIRLQGMLPQRLSDIEHVRVDIEPDVRVIISSRNANWTMTLPDTSPAAAAQFVQIAADAMAVVHNVREVYELRQSEALRDLSADLAERQADRDYWAVRVEELERELALDRSA